MIDENVIPNKIDEEIERGLNKLKTLDTGSEEYKKTLESVDRLHGLKLEAEKVELDYKARREKTQLDAGRSDEELRLKEAEEERMRDQAKDESKRFWIRLAADAGIMVVNLAFLAIQFGKGYRFEKDGTYTSTTFKEMRTKALGNLFKRN